MRNTRKIALELALRNNPAASIDAVIEIASKLEAFLRGSPAGQVDSSLATPSAYVLDASEAEPEPARSRPVKLSAVGQFEPDEAA